jgi:hypothetical protein
MPGVDQVGACLLAVLLLGAVNAGIVTIVVGATIFDGLRQRLSDVFPLFAELLGCATCTGTWVAAGTSALAIWWVGWTGLDAILAGVGLVFGQLTVSLLLRELGQFD